MKRNEEEGGERKEEQKRRRRKRRRRRLRKRRKRGEEEEKLWHFLDIREKEEDENRDYENTPPKGKLGNHQQIKLIDRKSGVQKFSSHYILVRPIWAKLEKKRVLGIFLAEKTFYKAFNQFFSSYFVLVSPFHLIFSAS